MGGGVIEDVEVLGVVVGKTGEERGASGYGAGGRTVPEDEEVLECRCCRTGGVDEGRVDVECWDCHFGGIGSREVL